MPRALRETLMSVGSVVILLSVLIAFDAGVRDQVSRRVLTHPGAEVVSVERQRARSHKRDRGGGARTEPGHAPLLIFTLWPRSVLVVFMLRT